jgi:hypothetical protein
MDYITFTWKGCGRRRLWYISVYYLGTRWEWLRKTSNIISLGSRCEGPNSKKHLPIASQKRRRLSQIARWSQNIRSVSKIELKIKDIPRCGTHRISNAFLGSRALVISTYCRQTPYFCKVSYLTTLSASRLYSADDNYLRTVQNLRFSQGWL